MTHFSRLHSERLVFFYFFGFTHDMWKIAGQQIPLQWQCCILNTLHHKGAPYWSGILRICLEVKQLITVWKSWLLWMRFLKRSCSPWSPLSSKWVFQACAIKNRVAFFPGLLCSKVIIAYTCFYAGFEALWAVIYHLVFSGFLRSKEGRYFHG